MAERDGAPYLPDTNHNNDTNGYDNLKIRALTSFNNVEEVYTHFKPVFSPDGSLIPNPSYRLIAARLGVNFPPFMIYVPENGFDYLNPNVVVEPIPEDEARDLRLPENLPRETFKSKLFQILKANNPALVGETLEDSWWGLIEDQLTLVTPFFVRRGYRIHEEDLKQVLTWKWPFFVENLLYMGAEKDERIVESAKSLLMPQFPVMRRCNSLNLWMTNPNTGKSVLGEKLGDVISRTTQRSITGGSRPDRSVVQSFLMSYRKPVTIEHLEATDTEELLAHLITAISGVQSKVIVFQTQIPFNPFCSLIVSGNPNKEKGQPNFEIFYSFIQGISKNYVALGRRVSIILYGDDFKVVRQEGTLESNPLIERLWVIWEEIASRILPLFREIFLSREIQSWIYSPDPEYQTLILGALEEDIVIREFLSDHAKNVYPALKYRALSSAVVDHAQRLLSIVIGEYEKDHLIGIIKAEVLELAKSVYERLRVINYESIKRIVETEKLDQRILQDIFNALPRYLRELLITIVHYLPNASTLSFSVDALTETFNDIKGRTEPKLYSGLSIIVQALNDYQPKRHFTRLANFGISLRQHDGSDLWIVTVTNLDKVEKLADVLSALSVVSVEHITGVSHELREAWDLKHGEEQLKRIIPESTYNEARSRAVQWLRSPRNREYDGHWSNFDEFQRIISTTLGGRMDLSTPLIQQMLAEGLIEYHPITKGKIRLTEAS